MAWFKVDDGLPVSRKVMSIPRTIRLASIGLWTLAGAWSASEELDGHVPSYMVVELGGTEKAAAALVKSGLWEKVDDGYQFSKWAEYQPTRADLEANRRREADRKREWRKRKSPAHVPVGQTPGHRAESGECPPLPDPTRPDLSTSNEVDEGGAKRARTRGTRLPDGWMPDQPVIDSMKLECPAVDLQAEHRKFVDYWQAKTGKDATKLDWNATWRNWIRRATPSAHTHHDPTRSGWDDLKTSTSHQLGA